MEFNLTWDMYVHVAPLAPHIDLQIQQCAFDSKQWKFWDHADISDIPPLRFDFTRLRGRIESFYQTQACDIIQKGNIYP